ncbi:hypothetical protein GCM10027199_06380 [Amycolatopsis magusensis]
MSLEYSGAAPPNFSTTRESAGLFACMLPGSGNVLKGHPLGTTVMSPAGPRTRSPSGALVLVGTGTVVVLEFGLGVAVGQNSGDAVGDPPGASAHPA